MDPLGGTPIGEGWGTAEKRHWLRVSELRGVSVSPFTVSLSVLLSSEVREVSAILASSRTVSLPLVLLLVVREVSAILASSPTASLALVLLLVVREVSAILASSPTASLALVLLLVVREVSAILASSPAGFLSLVSMCGGDGGRWSERVEEYDGNDKERVLIWDRPISKESAPDTLPLDHIAH